MRDIKKLSFIVAICLFFGCQERLNEMQSTNERVECVNAFEYEETNGVPICPNCKKPTKRTGGMGSRTLMYFEPVYNENGINTNPDRNISTTSWNCLECGESYTVSGNSVNGYSYRR